MEIEENLKIKEHFSSNRNEVYRVYANFIGEEKSAVMKTYSNRSSALLEYNNLLKLKENHINVPEVLLKTNNTLFLEYINGTLVNDLTQSLNLGNWIKELAHWVANLHKISNSEGNLLKSDVNLRNFIFSNDKIYGLDFEEMKYGDPREDIGEICFFLLNNAPAFTEEKNIMVKRFLKAYKEFSKNSIYEIEYFILKSAEKARKRRKMRFKHLI